MTTNEQRTQVFIEGLQSTPDLAKLCAELDDLSDLLAALEQRGEEGWPQVKLGPCEFAYGLATRLARKPCSPDGLREWFDTVLAEDLHLALGCASGSSAAITAFEKQYAGVLKRLLMRYRGPKMPEEDLRQHLYERLFVDAEDRPAKIHSYSGHGGLASWLQVTGTRLFIDKLRVTSRRHKEAPTHDEGQMLRMPDPDVDPELQFLKSEYRNEFKLAFERAARSLTSQERNLLRQHLVAGLTVDQLGKLYNIHRATAARRVAKAREALLNATRHELIEHLKLSDSEFDSIMELIRSRLDLSMPRLLRTVTDND